MSTQIVNFRAAKSGTEQFQTPKWARYYAYVYTFYMFVPLPESVFCVHSKGCFSVAGFRKKTCAMIYVKKKKHIIQGGVPVGIAKLAGILKKTGTKLLG